MSEQRDLRDRMRERYGLRASRLYSISAIGYFTSCPKKHEFAYIRNLAAHISTPALTLGIAGHRFLETLDKTGSVPGAISDYRKHIDGYMALYRKVKNEEPAGFQEKAIGLEGVLITYANVFPAADAEEYVIEPEKVEVEFGFDLNARYGIVGRMDGIRKKRMAGRDYVWENKFLSAFDEDMNMLVMDYQLSTYILGARLALGLDIAHGVYNVVRKPLLRVKKEETLEAFEERCRATSATEQEKYFKRSDVYRSDEQLEETKTYLIQVCTMIDTLGYRWRNVSSECTWKCPFFSICPTEDPDLIAREFYVRDGQQKH